MDSHLLGRRIAAILGLTAIVAMGAITAACAKEEQKAPSGNHIPEILPKGPNSQKRRMTAFAAARKPFVALVTGRDCGNPAIEIQTCSP